MSEHFALIRFDSLGDLILITPVIRNLHLAYPDCRITLVTRRPYDELFYADPDVDRVVATGGLLDRDGLPGTRAAARALADERFDAVIDLQGNIASRLLARQLRARRRAHHARMTWARMKLVYFKRFARPLPRAAASPSS